jgi:hypothetical protein
MTTPESTGMLVFRLLGDHIATFLLLRDVLLCASRLSRDMNRLCRPRLSSFVHSRHVNTWLNGDASFATWCGAEVPAVLAASALNYRPHQGFEFDVMLRACEEGSFLNLKHLFLYASRIGNGNLIAMTRMIGRCNALVQLQSLDLDYNRISDEGFGTFAMVGVECLRKLSRLTMRHNAIGDVGMQAWREAIVKGAFPRLKVLDLFGNCVGPVGMVDLCCHAIPVMQELSTLGIGQMDFFEIYDVNCTAAYDVLATAIDVFPESVECLLVGRRAVGHDLLTFKCRAREIDHHPAQDCHIPHVFRTLNVPDVTTFGAH